VLFLQTTSQAPNAAFIRGVMEYIASASRSLEVDFTLCQWVNLEKFTSVASQFPSELNHICLPAGTKELRKAVDFVPAHDALSYMAALVRGCSRGSQIEFSGDWRGESASRLMQYFRMASNVALSRGRSVWFMTRPLDNSSSKSLSLFAILALFKPISVIAHWGIIVSDLSKPQLEEMISTSRSNSERLGDLHELRNIGGTTHYQHGPYVHDLDLSLQYVGQTEMDDDTLSTYGRSSFKS
jgi:hypothetical protein